MLTYLTTGESHGPQLTAVLDGFPAGFPIDLDKLNHQLARRQKAGHVSRTGLLGAIQVGLEPGTEAHAELAGVIAEQKEDVVTRVQASIVVALICDVSSTEPHRPAVPNSPLLL